MQKPCNRGYIVAVWTGVRVLQRYHRSKETLVSILCLPFKCGPAGKECLVLLNLQVFLKGFGTIKTLFKA